MATDSAELTFVRCRSCGALVPATAAKCRICNAALESGAKADDSAEVKGASGRVRQRTMSAPAGDVMDVVSKLRDEPPPPPPPTGGNDGDDDPLGAYLEEVEDDVPTAASAVPGGLDAGDDDFDLDDEPIEPVSMRRSFEPMEEDDRDFGGATATEPPAPKRAGRGVEEVRSNRGPKLQPRLRSDEEARGAPQRSSRPAPAAAKQEPRGRSASSGSATMESSAQQGQLVGWLVSYREAEGTAIELREGKLFVTGSPFKGTDLLLDDPSVSTPHALLSISVQNGIRVQDFMSDHGLFARSGKSGEYQRTDGPIALKHGDWVKFGEVEFLVCSVAKSDGN